jgi:hypothetical protein
MTLTANGGRKKEIKKDDNRNKERKAGRDNAREVVAAFPFLFWSGHIFVRGWRDELRSTV